LGRVLDTKQKLRLRGFQTPLTRDVACGFSEDLAISPKEFLLEKQRIQMLSEFLSNDRALREVAKLVDFYQKPFRIA
jgi:hypothetical protein